MSLNPNQYTILPGGMRAGVLQMDGHDLVHSSVLSDVLCSVIESEAKAHDAGFQPNHFKKIIDAVRVNKISAYFILAGWENCQPRIAGASIEFPTVLTKWDGSKFQHYPAMYGEDTCILRKSLRELIVGQPSGREFPEVGLGAYFEQERIKRWITNQYGDAPLGMTARARIGEYSSHSLAMMKVLGEFGATLGTEQKGTILEINGLTRSMKDKWKVHTDIEEIKYGSRNEPYPNILCVNWSSRDEKQQMCASFTNGISTFTGEAITRVQVTSNGNLPDDALLQCVMASLLATGEKDIEKRRWGSSLVSNLMSNMPSPLIPLLGSQQEMHKALLEAARHEISAPRMQGANENYFWGCKAPLMRIHALGEPKIVTALRAMDAQSRLLGKHPMLPVVMEFKNMAKEKLPFNVRPTKPVEIVKLTKTANMPIFSLMANL